MAVAQMIAITIMATEAAMAMKGSPTLIADIKAYIDHVALHLAKENHRLFINADMILQSRTDQVNSDLAHTEEAKLKELGKIRSQYEKLVSDVEFAVRLLYGHAALATVGRQADIDRMLRELHASYLKDNERDEGDPIYYRINYRLADTFGITKEEADRLHSIYHSANPRQVSQGYCNKCGRVVTIIPVIYGIQEDDMERMKTAEAEGRLIIGDMSTVRQGSKVAMFGCKACRTVMPKYGTL